MKTHKTKASNRQTECRPTAATDLITSNARSLSSAEPSTARERSTSSGGGTLLWARWFTGFSTWAGRVTRVDCCQPHRVESINQQGKTPGAAATGTTNKKHRKKKEQFFTAKLNRYSNGVKKNYTTQNKILTTPGTRYTAPLCPSTRTHPHP